MSFSTEYRIAKARDKASKDYTHIKQMKNEHGIVLSDHDQIKDRWKEYFANLLNEENPRGIFGDRISNEGLTTEVSREEVKNALTK